MLWLAAWAFHSDASGFFALPMAMRRRIRVIGGWILLKVCEGRLCEGYHSFGASRREEE